MSVERLDGLCPKLELTTACMAQLRSAAGDECDELPLRALDPHADRAHGFFSGGAPTAITTIHPPQHRL